VSVQVAITKLELSFVLAKVKSKFGVPIWEIKEHFLVGAHPHRKFSPLENMGIK
jgi:hypothetical protein